MVMLLPHRTGSWRGVPGTTGLHSAGEVVWMRPRRLGDWAAPNSRCVCVPRPGAVVPSSLQHSFSHISSHIHPPHSSPTFPLSRAFRPTHSYPHLLQSQQVPLKKRRRDEAEEEEEEEDDYDDDEEEYESSGEEREERGKGKQSQQQRTGGGVAAAAAVGKGGGAAAGGGGAFKARRGVVLSDDEDE